MFVQATKSKRGNKTYISYLVRESFRTPKGPRSRTICNISGLPPEVRDLIAAALAGKPYAALESLALSGALDYGGLAVLRDAWQRFGLDRALAAIPDARQRALLQAMIFGRVLCAPAPNGRWPNRPKARCWRPLAGWSKRAKASTKTNFTTRWTP
jgi:hypothetical protein